MEAITYLAALSLALSGSGKSAKADFVGTWRVQLAPEVRDTVKKMGIAEPQALFVFNADNTFVYNSNAAGFTKTCNGTYEVSEHALKLTTPDNSWPAGQIADLKEDHSLNVNGLKYVKEGAATLAGVWKLVPGSGQDASTKMVFEKDGSFTFTGRFVTSRGRYTVEGASVTLNWTEIDGENVELGTVHKTVTISPDGCLQIDTFRYQKQ